MGNRRSRELSRPKDRGRPCTSDIFDAAVDYDGTYLTVMLTTDLPAGTRVSVTARRLYREPDNSETFWTALEDSYPVTKQGAGSHGFKLRFTALELDTKGLNMYRSLKGRWPTQVAAPPCNELELTLHAPNSPHRFGICNRRLSGKAVTVKPSGHYIERSITVLVPTSPEVIRQLGL